MRLLTLGNSGGPLINLNGEVIGINSVKITSADGIGFAVPINVVKPIVEKLAKNVSIEEAYLGIFGFDRNVIPYLSDNLDFSSGIYVAQIALDGPCFGSGLQVGDVIVKVNDFSINKMCDLREFVYGKKPGDSVAVTFVHNRSYTGC